MNNRLVSDCTQVISTLYGKSESVNNIIRETGIYKTYIHNALRKLKKEKLIEQNKSKRGKKIESQLTRTGNTLGELLYNIRQFRANYSLLMQSIYENLDIEPDLSVTTQKTPIPFEEQLKSKLMSRGWKPDEISSYWSLAGPSKQFGIQSGYIFIVSLCARYLSLIFTSEIGKNELTRHILTQIFTDTINSRAALTGPYKDEKSIILNDREFEIDQASVNENIDIMAYTRLSIPVISYLMDYTSTKESGKFINNKFIKTEAQNVMSSIHCILEPKSERTDASQIPELRFDGW